jgi:hypothetical protein
LKKEDAAKWQEMIKRRNSQGTWLKADLLESDAFKDLADPAVKVLLWFYLRARRAKKEKRPGGRDQGGEFLNEDLLFAYNEAEYRGLSHGKFRRCLKELHATGFIDISHPGSARRGDETKYRISSRWRSYKSNPEGERGGSLFDRVSYPKSVHWVNFGFQSRRGKKGKKVVSKCQK